jgi:hypothetical protein
MAQLTLSEKSNLARSESFRFRVFQALYAKANYWVLVDNAGGAPANLAEQKKRNYAKSFVTGLSSGIDAQAAARFWLANYTADPPDLIGSPSPDEGQPSDGALLNDVSTDVVFNRLVGVEYGDTVTAPE